MILKFEIHISKFDEKNKLISAFDIYDENLLLQIKSYIIEVKLSSVIYLRAKKKLTR